LRAALLERGVAVRVFAKDPRLAGCVRVTVGTPDENAAFLAALRAVLAG
jgi:histidinol-phosphate aminotransferase